MNWLVMSVVISITFLAACWGYCRLTREPRIPVERLADPRPLPGDLCPCGNTTLLACEASPCSSFPDTGPLLLLSEAAAAIKAHEREVRAMGDEAERKIPARWR